MRFPERLFVLRKADQGAALVELALVIPILLLLVAGAVDFGYIFYVGLQVGSAAHIGAEYGSQNPGESAGVTTAAQAIDPHVTVKSVSYGCECSDGTSYNATCSVQPSCTQNSTRGGNVVWRVQVTTQESVTPILTWPGFPSTFNLTSTATVRGYHL